MEPKVLVVIPTYNERDNVGALCEELLARPEALHVLVVDDNSPDGTAAAAREVAARHPGRMDVLCREGKGGRGGAVLAGLAHGLRGDYELFFEMDADFSHRPEEIPLFLEAAAAADVVVGSRYLPASRIVNCRAAVGSSANGPTATRGSFWGYLFPTTPTVTAATGAPR